MSINTFISYIAIIIIGTVISLLYFFVGNDESTGYFFIYFTVYVATTVRFLLEWKHYRRHGAILASSQFLILPYLVLVTGLFLSRNIDAYSFIYISFSMFGGSNNFIVNLISLTMIPQILVLFRLFYFYHAGRWLGFAIHKKLFNTRFMPYMINMIFALLMIFLSYSQSTVDGVAFLLVITWIIHTFKHYILVNVRLRGSSPVQSLDNALSNRPATGTWRNYIDDTLERPQPRRRSGDIPALPRDGIRTVSSSYKDQKNVTAKSRKKRSEKPAQRQTQKPAASRTSSTSRRSGVGIDPGREVSPSISSKPKQVGTSGIAQPLGHVMKGDLKCIFCYEEFKLGDKPVILCPHCKYPGHENEFLSWNQMSQLCARCSKPITKSYVKNPRYRYAAKDYINKVINKLN